MLRSREREKVQAGIENPFRNLGSLKEGDLVTSTLEFLRKRDQWIQMARPGEGEHSESPTPLLTMHGSSLSAQARLHFGQ